MANQAKPIRILLAEDSRFLRRATELILSKAGYEVITAADGVETLSVARTASPDLIILDLMMPKMNGIEVLRSLKHDPTTSAVPVIILSGLSQQHDLKLLEAGAAAYYEKTKLIPEALESIVQNVLTGGRASAQRVSEFPASPQSSNTKPPAKVESGVYRVLQGVLPSPKAQPEYHGNTAEKDSDYENELLDQIITLNTELANAQAALAKANEELRRVAEIDPLTEVPNRRKACQDIEKLLALARRQKASVCFAVLDLDHFKRINDTYGHAAGDSVLHRFGKFLSKSVRTEDVVGRWGGEEFVLALYGCSKEDALNRLNRLREQFQQERFNSESGVFQVTFSGGVAGFPSSGSSHEMVFEAADRALYEAKNQGRNRIVADHNSAEQKAAQAPAMGQGRWQAGLAGFPASAMMKN